MDAGIDGGNGMFYGYHIFLSVRMWKTLKIRMVQLLEAVAGEEFVV